MSFISKLSGVCAAAGVLVATAAPAEAGSRLDFDLDAVQATFSGGPVVEGGTFTLDLSTAAPPDPTILTVQDDDTTLFEGAGGAVTIDGTINVVNGVVDSGDFTIGGFGNTYTNTLSPGATAQVFNVGSSSDLSIVGLTGFGSLSNSTIGATDVSEFFNSPLQGVYRLFTVSVDNNSASFDVTAAAVVPVPASAMAVAPMMLGLVAYRRVKKRRAAA